MAVENPMYAFPGTSENAGPELFRRAVSSLYNSAGGCLGANDLNVTATSSTTVSVAYGQAWIPGTQSVQQGMYYGLNDAALVLDAPAAPSSGSQISSVIWQVLDTAYTGAAGTLNGTAVPDGSALGAIYIISGTAASSPVAPTLPANSLRLANITIAAGASNLTSNITDTRIFAYPANLPRNTPSARMWQTSQNVFTSKGSWQGPLGNFSPNTVQGGMIVSTSSITLPVSGVYGTYAYITYQASDNGPPAPGYYATGIAYNGTVGSSWRTVHNPGSTPAPSYPQPGGFDAVWYPAGTVLQVYGWNNNEGGDDAGTYGEGSAFGLTWFGAFLIG